ncbi:MAG: DUF1015 domain-containing protein [Actinomycetia bacterium]|nr:DUF1015 domain-containing protein [Actinomycetes bacterium]MCP4086625.1 DUF1015 domain-containing protein [Actinomycetes bacterium]
MASVAPLPLSIVDSDWAERVVSPAHDSLTPSQRRQHLLDYPDSYLGVTRSPGDIGPADHWTVDDLLRAGRQALDRLRDEGAFSAPGAPSMLVMQLDTGAHVQTGLVTGVAVTDVDSGVIRAHEQFHPDRATILTNHFEIVGTQSSPVALAHRPDDQVRALTTRVIDAHDPDLDIAALDGLHIRVWRIESDLVEAMTTAFARHPLYLIDGHHRSAAASAFRQRVGPGTADWMLAVVFPTDELLNRAHHRLISPARGVGSILASLAVTGSLHGPVSEAEMEDRERSELAVWASGGWYLVDVPLPDDDGTPEGAIERLDAVRLQHHVINPLLDHPDDALAYRPGGTPMEQLTGEADREGAILARMRPVSIDDLLRVSDAGLTMPPKSTYFEPKVRSGVIIRDL